MADNAPPADPFLKFEPSTHPEVGATAAAVTQAVTPTNSPTDTPITPAPVVTPAPGPTGVAAPVPQDPFAIPTMTDPSGQSNIEAASTGIDLLNPPITYPTVHGLMVAGGSAAGAAVGVPAGGIVADVVTVPAGAIMGGMAGDAAYMVFQNILDALRGTKNAQGEPITLSQQSLSMLKNSYMAAGGVEGQIAGKVLATAGAKALNLSGKMAGEALKAGGSIVGGGLGTAAGGLTADGALALGKMWSIIPPDQRTPDMLQAIKDNIVNGGLDMVVNTALHSPLAVKAGARQLAYMINGITPSMIADAEVARSFGINLSMNNLTKRTTINGLYRTITSVIPAVGHPYHDLFDKQVQAATGYAKDIPSNIAGGDPGSISSVGKSVVNRANLVFQPVVDAYNDKFAQIIGRAKAANVRFSLNSTAGIDAEGNSVPSLKKWAGTILKPAEARVTPQYDMRPGAVPGSLLPVEIGKTNVTTENKELLQFADKISKAPDTMTVDQLNALGEEGDLIYKKYVEAGDPSDPSVKVLAAKLKNFNDSLHGAFTDSHSLDPKAASWPAIGEDVIKNDKEFADTRKLFTNPTGQSLLARNVNPDAIGEAIFKMNDPTKVNELKQIVGSDLTNRAAAVVIKHAVEDSVDGLGTKAVLNLNRFKLALGLDNPTGNRYQAISAALEGSPIKMSDLEAFAKAYEQAQQGLPPSFATMIVRKMTFGGLNSIMKTLLPTGSALAGASMFGPHVGAVPTAGLILMGWKGAEIMSNPKYLADATTFLSKASGEAEARMALYRVAKAVLVDDTPQYPADTKGTGKTPPRTIMEKVFNAEQRGSSFLQSLVPQ